MNIENSTARVVVIGGGVVGCSILYHLAKAGWEDVVLLERQELTSGSSWHAAGSLYSLTTPFNASVLQKYTFDLYPQLEKESGQDCGFHRTGELWLAESEEQYKAFKVIQAQGRRNGIHAEFLSMNEAKQMSPILNTDGLKAVMFEPDAGFCDPAGVTNAFAIAARNLGAKIYRHSPVIETNNLDHGEWQVVTKNGTITTEFVVNAAGLWGREVATLAGITLPLVPVQHHYLVTEDIPEIVQMSRKLPSLAINEANVYSRQEGKGLLVGAYESSCHLWSEYGTPTDFGHELLPNDLERMEDNFNVAVERMPCLAQAGIKSVINGPMIFSPDLGPLIGSHPKLQNYFCANGVMTGFNQGSGVGKVLAQWITQGDPEMDMTFWHVGRFGDYANHEYTKARAKFFYEHRSTMVYPHQDFNAGRPVRKRPIYEMQKKSGAVFAEYMGWEDPLYFARNESEKKPRYTFERGNWVDVVKDEVLAVHHNVGLFDYSTFAKYTVEGPDAYTWLNYVLAGKVPDRKGQTTLCPMLNSNGKLLGDFTVSCIDENRYFLAGAGSMQDIHKGLFVQLQNAKSITIENVTDTLCGFHIAGPHAAGLLADISKQNKLTGFLVDSLSFLSNKILAIANCDQAIVIRVSFTGESGFEIYMPAEYQLSIHKAIVSAGEGFKLKQVGSHALMSMRLEKSFPSWGLELSSDYHPWHCNMQRFIRINKGEFIGRKASLLNAQSLADECLVTLEINVDDKEAFGGEPLYCQGNLAGYVTSGGYGYRINKNLALGYIKSEYLSCQSGFEIEMIGERYSVTMLNRSPFDPDNTRMQS